MTNDLEEPASFHLHGSSLRVAGTGDAAVAANPDSLAQPGDRVTYEWMVPANEPEATHYFHSHGDERVQTGHGLFGALVVEPPGSTWTDPLTGEPTETGWQAVISQPGEEPFREFAIYYHEIGHENYRLLDADNKQVPIVDPHTSAYRPAARALNYRSEPFLNRLELAEEVTGRADESLEYSSYSFGDPATPMLRTYVGERTKQRVVHGGSEVFHVHHVHGGTIRWPRQPGVEGTTFGERLEKDPRHVPEVSERTDSQTLGPSESFDVAPECAAGGCQQGVGDFMIHCHVGHHYFAGMWTIWRTYNTLQDGASSTDDLPPLAALDDADQPPLPSVTSDELIGRRLETPTGSVEVSSESLADIVERQLPPAGVPADGDASVFDWIRAEDRYLNEPETTASWAGYAPTQPGERPPLRFDPRTGRLAYPMLRPHLAERPPFAPGHGPAPFLDPVGNQRDPPEPGVSGPRSLCPAGTAVREFPIVAVRTPVMINEEESLLDPNGMLFVLRSQRDRVTDDRSLQVPLALRTNAGDDCVDVLLRSELRDDPTTPFSKVGIHIHFVQFDVQASDGVNVGFNFEQTIRPYSEVGTPIAAPANAGSTTVQVEDASRLRSGALVGTGMELDEGFEVARIAAIDEDTLELADPLRADHEASETVSTEFVRYRWYPDAQFGTAYFHDHVDALTTWRHGLFGALVAEPSGATWTHPETGEPLESGPIADIHTDQPVGLDVTGSFRELLLFTQDDNPLTHVGRSTGGTMNLRAEPLDDREGPPQVVFSSEEHGDPETPIVRAHLGDPIVIRDLVGASNEVHTLHVDGHWFRTEAFSSDSRPVAAIDVGISERFDLVLPAAGGPQRMTGDYLYENGRPTKLAEGNWGLIRVLPPGDDGIQPLDRGGEPSVAAEQVCPENAPVRRFEVAAIEVPLPMLDGDPGRIFATAATADAIENGDRPPEPLVLRATVGDCLEIELTNQLPDTHASFRTDLLARDPSTDAGVAAGREPPQTAAPGETRTYRLHASPEVGATVATVRDGANPVEGPRRGLYGAIIIAESGASIRDPDTGEELGGSSSYAAEVVTPDGVEYRDFAVFLHDEDEAIGSHLMPYTIEVDGPVAINYQREPLDERTLAAAAAEGATTPLLEARAGEPLRIHVLALFSEQAQVFSVEGHRWGFEPDRAATPQLSSQRFGGLQALTLEIASAGGPEAIPGDYVYGNHRMPHREAGAWGILRVHPAASAEPPRAEPAQERGGGLPVAPLALGVIALLTLGLGAALRARRD
ncbi:MAG: multicopper oxidase domain-containing protein [Nitriliruptorales bacterium]|nr:multicopper oxidase domain-containing protein [Nitriliruptorales bacterium]